MQIKALSSFRLFMLVTVVIVVEFALFAMPSAAQQFICGTTSVVTLPSDSPLLTTIDIGGPVINLGTYYEWTSWAETSAQSWAGFTNIPLQGGPPEMLLTRTYDPTGLKVGKYCAYFPYNWTSRETESDCGSHPRASRG